VALILSGAGDGALVLAGPQAHLGAIAAIAIVGAAVSIAAGLTDRSASLATAASATAQSAATKAAGATDLALAATRLALAAAVADITGRAEATRTTGQARRPTVAAMLVLASE
jgi:hypothetical protein